MDGDKIVTDNDLSTLYEGTIHSSTPDGSTSTLPYATVDAEDIRIYGTRIVCTTDGLRGPPENGGVRWSGGVISFRLPNNGFYTWSAGQTITNIDSEVVLKNRFMRDMIGFVEMDFTLECAFNNSGTVRYRCMPEYDPSGGNNFQQLRFVYNYGTLKGVTGQKFHIHDYASSSISTGILGAQPINSYYSYPRYRLRIEILSSSANFRFYQSEVRTLVNTYTTRS